MKNRNIVVSIIGFCVLFSACGKQTAPIVPGGFQQTAQGPVPPQGHGSPTNPVPPIQDPLDGEWKVTNAGSSCAGTPVGSFYTQAWYAFNILTGMGEYDVFYGNQWKYIPFSFTVNPSGGVANSVITASSPPVTGTLTIFNFQPQQCSTDLTGMTGYDVNNCSASSATIPPATSITFTYQLSVPTLVTPTAATGGTATGVTPTVPVSGASVYEYSQLGLTSQGPTDYASCKLGTASASQLVLQ